MYCRSHLLTVLTHGWYSQGMADQLHLLVHENKDDVLLLETNCPDHLMSHDQLPWKRCNRNEGKVYPYLQTLTVSILFSNSRNDLYQILYFIPVVSVLSADTWTAAWVT